MRGLIKKFRVGHTQVAEEAIKAKGVPQVGETTPSGTVEHATAVPWRVGFIVHVYIVDAPARDSEDAPNNTQLNEQSE